MQLLSEKEVSRIWQYQCFSTSSMRTESGEQVEVVYPGRPNDDRGADFCNAVISVAGRLEKGDVEIHVKSSDWLAHRHHRDPSYHKVILHAVMWHNTNTLFTSHYGRNIPILVLRKYACLPPVGYSEKDTHDDLPYLHFLKSQRTLTCAGASRGASDTVPGEVLDDLGEARFRMKADKFRVDLSETEAEQCLYQGVMVALGYAKNKTPFLELAHRVPLSFLRGIAGDTASTYDERLARMQALLLHTAGLLRHLSFEPDDWRTGSSRGSCPSLGFPEPMSSGSWQLFKNRPANSPIHRIAAMSHLVLRFYEKGILQEVLNRTQGASPKESCDHLMKAFVVNSGGCRTDHGGQGFKPQDGKALLGSARAAEIIVNVTLPFVSAWGDGNSHPEMKTRAFHLYRFHPRLYTNSIEKHMTTQLGLERNVVNSARRQQGLIHLYRNFCVEGACSKCPLTDRVTPS